MMEGDATAPPPSRHVAHNVLQTSDRRATPYGPGAGVRGVARQARLRVLLADFAEQG
jgi:hypothetical protein